MATKTSRSLSSNAHGLLMHFTYISGCLFVKRELIRLLYDVDFLNFILIKLKARLKLDCAGFSRVCIVLVVFCFSSSRRHFRVCLFVYARVLSFLQQKRKINGKKFY